MNKEQLLQEVTESLNNQSYDTMTPKDQRAITADWAELIPDMKRINNRTMGLYKRIGSMIIGLSLGKNKSATIYKPHLICTSICFVQPGIPITFALDTIGEYEGKHVGSMITLNTHEDRYKNAFNVLKSKSTFQLKQEVTVEEVVMAYREYILKKKGFITSEIHDQALIPAWAGDTRLAQDSLEWAQKHKNKVLHSGPRMWLKLKDDDWLTDLEQRISNPELLRKTVKDEVKKHKLEKIPFYNFIDSPYQE